MKKIININSLKKTLSSLLLISLILLFSSCTAQNKGESTQSSNKSINNDISKDASAKDKQPEVNNQPEEKPIEQVPMIVNSIKGESNRLTAKDKAAMAKWREDIVNLAKKNQDEVFINGYTSEKVVALTFDDGPDSNITPKVSDFLKQHNIKGSFFFIGERAAAYPSVVKKVYEDGNLVLNHSYNHPELSKMDENSIEDQITRTNNIIYKIIGKTPALIRPPYGDANDKVVDVFKKNNSKMIIWSIDTLDWSQREKENIAKNVIDNVRPGEIILMHCDGDKINSLEALPLIVDGLQKKGYNFVDLGELLKVNPYK